MTAHRITIQDGMVTMPIAEFIDMYNLAYRPADTVVADDDPILDTVPHRAFCLCKNCKPGSL